MNTSESWTVLRNYESRELVRRRYHETHGREANAGMAREISSALSQAREYFDSARSADLIVRPLLLYYGVMQLSRGAIMFLVPGRREATLAARHGLSESGWRDCIAQEPLDISNLTIALETNGTLRELSDAVKHRTLLRVSTSAVNNVVEHEPLRGGWSLTIGDLLARVPELATHYRRWKQPELSLHASWTVNDGVTRVTINRNQAGREVSDKDVAAVFAHCNYGIISTGPDKIVATAGIKPNEFPTRWDAINPKMFGIGDAVLVARYSGGHELVLRL